MTLTPEQQRIVEENQKLVWKVIHERIHNPDNILGMTKDDLFQIGCIGLCKAAYTDKYQASDVPSRSAFSTYAYRLIYHELCNALEQNTRKNGRDTCFDEEIGAACIDDDLGEVDNSSALKEALEQARKNAKGGVAIGIEMLILVSQGYKYKEIGRRFGVPDNYARAYTSKARCYLRQNPDIQAIKAVS